MENIKFRNANEKDFVEFNKVYEKTTYLGEQPFSFNPMSAKEYMDLVEQEGIILMEYADSIIGYSIVKAFDDGECIIKDVYILQEFQNKGLGRKFVNFIEKTAQEAGMNLISLMSATIETDEVWKKLGYNSEDFSDKYIKKL